MSSAVQVEGTRMGWNTCEVLTHAYQPNRRLALHARVPVKCQGQDFILIKWSFRQYSWHILRVSMECMWPKWKANGSNLNSVFRAVHQKNMTCVWSFVPRLSMTAYFERKKSFKNPVIYAAFISEFARIFFSNFAAIIQGSMGEWCRTNR